MRCIYHIQKTTWCLWPVNKLSQWLNCDGSNFPTTTYNSLIFFWSYNLLETFWSTWSWKEKQSGHLPATHTLKTIQKPQLAWNKNSFWVFVSVFFTKKAVKVKGDISPHNPHKPGVTTSAHLIPMLLHWQEKWTGVGDLDVLLLVAFSPNGYAIHLGFHLEKLETRKHRKTGKKCQLENFFQHTWYTHWFYNNLLLKWFKRCTQRSHPHQFLSSYQSLPVERFWATQLTIWNGLYCTSQVVLKQSINTSIEYIV